MIPYKPEPLVDFNNQNHFDAFEQSLAKVTEQLGQTYPLVIGHEQFLTSDKKASWNPSNREEIIGWISKADRGHIELALRTAHETFATWSKTSPEARAELLFKTAAIIRRRKHEFSAWLLLEAGKSRAEADADTAETIDFLEYYGRQILELSRRAKETLVPFVGERNRMEYIPLGVGIVIPPWNFPFAIMAGMTSAAIVSGNTVLLKPAGPTPVIAFKFLEALQEAGMPAGVVNFVPGDSGEIGDFMIQHKLTRFISFTGSRDVGLRINELAAKRSDGQLWIKRYIAEMGGKDSIIVDADADLESAAKGIVFSSFGFSGQKCSACSRAIVHEDIYDELLSRCVELTRALKVGDVRNPEKFVGPVIDEKAFNMIREYIEIGKTEGILACGGESTDENGYFIQPTIFADVAPDARIMQEEIFGPVVAFTKVASFTEALAVANNTEFGLTGSVFTRDREHIERARSEFHVGNLYFNRKCTGAVVGVHPFGGFNMSGTDSKAGGPDYLMLFTQAKVSSELL